MPGSRSTAMTSLRAARASVSPPMPAQRSTTSGQAKASGLVPGDRFGRGLLDGGRLDPHERAALEFERRLWPGTGEPNRGRDSRRRSQLPQASQVGGTDRSHSRHLVEQREPGLGEEHPGFGWSMRCRRRPDGLGVIWTRAQLSIRTTISGRGPSWAVERGDGLVGTS